jgi:cytochrome c
MSRLAALLLALAMIASSCPATAGDDEGQIAYNTHCRTCHSIRKGDNRLGPSLADIYGAKAGQVEGFRGYSGGLGEVTWDEPTLDLFIANPTAISTSTNMTYPPVADPAERKKIINYLKSISGR